MSNHTAGPWDFEPFEEHTVRPTVATVGDYRVVRSGRGARGYDLHGQDEDDARLIAAAPDLLDALKSLSASIFIPDGEQSVELSTAIKMTIAAIAKAEGRI